LFYDVGNTLAFVLVSVMLTGLFYNAYADVMIPEDEILGYYDSEGIYTIVGAVKNTENYSVQPVIYLTVLDNNSSISITQNLPKAFPDKDIPFKIKIPEVSGDSALIKNYDVSFERDDSVESKIEVMYDRSLKKHADGHLTGKIVNKGNQTEYDVKVYATIHGENNSFIDVAKNLEKIDKIGPGQIIEFTMYPDPMVADDVHYYSCFALGDETIVPLYAIRDGEKFNFRYDSTAWFIVDEGFDDAGTELSLKGVNSFRFPTYVNFEFPKTSDNEKFSVLVDDNPVQFIQSVDEEGNWHVAFDVTGSTQNRILISGFEKPDSILPQTNELLVESGDTEFEQKTQQPKSRVGLDYSFLYYVIPIVVAVVIGIIVYSRKRVKNTA
jgi:hypothetical protein